MTKWIKTFNNEYVNGSLVEVLGIKDMGGPWALYYCIGNGGGVINEFKSESEAKVALEDTLKLLEQSS